MLKVLQQYRTEPREISQEQLYTLALFLQLLHDQEKTGNQARCSEYFRNFFWTVLTVLAASKLKKNTCKSEVKHEKGIT